jgi:hypothetical protein
MKTKNIIITAVIGLILFSFGGCSMLKKRVESKEIVKYTFNSSKSSIRIDNSNGKINISNSEDTTGRIVIEAEKIAHVRVDDLNKPIDAIRINIDSTDSELVIETEINESSGIFHKNEDTKVNYEVKIPASMKVRAENVNGVITITRMNSDVSVETVNGNINVFNCPGLLDLSGVNGSITCNVDSVTSGIRVDMVNGSVKLGGLKNINADVTASTINGRVKFTDLQFSNLNSEKKSLTGTLGKGGNSIRVETTNGSIVLDANRVAPKKDDSFEFKIDLGDDEEPIRIKKTDHNIEIGPDSEPEEREDNHNASDTNRGRNNNSSDTNRGKK